MNLEGWWGCDVQRSRKTSPSRSENCPQKLTPSIRATKRCPVQKLAQMKQRMRRFFLAYVEPAKNPLSTWHSCPVCLLRIEIRKTCRYCKFYRLWLCKRLELLYVCNFFFIERWFRTWFILETSLHRASQFLGAQKFRLFLIFQQSWIAMQSWHPTRHPAQFLK